VDLTSDIFLELFGAKFVDPKRIILLFLNPNQN